MKCSKEIDTVFVIRRGKRSSFSLLSSSMACQWKNEKKSEDDIHYSFCILLIEQNTNTITTITIPRFECDETSLVDIDVCASRKTKKKNSPLYLYRIRTSRSGSERIAFIGYFDTFQRVFSSLFACVERTKLTNR